MSDALEVSVVLAVRDGERELAATLDGILAQRGVAFEVIAVDDGSRDGTPALLAAAAMREPRLRLVRQERIGLTPALARGCAAASSPVIARHDVGDLSHPDRLARQKALLDRHPEVVLVSCWTACVGPAAEPLYLETKSGEPGRPLDLFVATDPARPVAGPTSHGSALFRRAAYEAAGRYREEFALGQDWDLWCRLGLLGKFAMVGAALYLRRLQPRSLGFGAHDLQRRFGELARAAAARRRAGEDDRDLLAEAARLSARFARERGARLRRSEALGSYHLGALLRELGEPAASAYFAAALRRRPWLLRAWARWVQARLRPRPRRMAAGFDTPEAAALLAAAAAERRVAA